MKNFVIGLISGFILAGLTGFILFFALVRIAASFGEKPTKVAEGSTLIFNLDDSVPEKPATEIPLPFLEEQTPLSMQQVWETFRKAAADSRIKAVIFEPRGLSIGWGRMQEIRQEMQQFRKSGKPLIAFLRNPGTREYYLATATDRIFMAPEDQLDVKGVAVEPLFIKNTLDKLGIGVDVIHAGKYKDAGDMLTRTEMTPETRQVLNDVLDQFYGDLINVTATGRKKQPEEIKALIDKGPFMADQALAAGLVDKLAYEDQVAAEVSKRLNQKELTRISSRQYLNVPAATAGISGGKRIALVVGEGEIVRGPARSGLSEDQGIVSGSFIKLLQKVENDSTIKGAIIRVNSPGGDGVASDDILHEMRNLSRKKPIVVSMSDLAASGGYFISVTGDPIVAYPNTLTGSIGVIYARFNLRGFYDKIGVTRQLLTRGRFADLNSDYHPLTEDQKTKVRDQIDEFYRVFVKRVSDGRKRPFDQVAELAQGRVWMGAQARQNGLVDELGGLDRAIELVKKRAGIAATDQVTLVPFPPKRSLLDMLTSRPDETPSVDLAIRKILGCDLPVESLRLGGFLKLMPYVIAVR
jgi:protease-4